MFTSSHVAIPDADDPWLVAVEPSLLVTISLQLPSIAVIA
jgi:hypothetical protein